MRAPRAEVQANIVLFSAGKGLLPFAASPRKVNPVHLSSDDSRGSKGAHGTVCLISFLIRLYVCGRALRQSCSISPGVTPTPRMSVICCTQATLINAN